MFRLYQLVWHKSIGTDIKSYISPFNEQTKNCPKNLVTDLFGVLQHDYAEHWRILSFGYQKKDKKHRKKGFTV